MSQKIIKTKIIKESTLKIPAKSDLYERIYELVRQIPKGRATSYGAIGDCIGTGMSARVVGWAMNNAHNIMPRVPAHRVVNRNGMLTGKFHFATPTLMQDLLKAEGLEVEDDIIVNFKTIFWAPCQSKRN
jgi:methylated-DNA-protein-cysteine methyltransferase related protein